MDKNVYAAIQSQYSTLSKVGKRIADYILADPVHITSISIQQMAAELDIAESSIIRFCKIVGCAGFSEVKLLLAKYSPKSVRTIFEDLSETDSISTISESVFSRNIDTLERALQLLDFEKIEQAVGVLKNVEGIGICELTDQDVVRHVMVQRIIKAYADYEDARNEKRKR